jgi:hypothetical protein
MLPSGSCSRQVREWLGMPDDEPEPSTASDPFVARPARCGLAQRTVYSRVCTHA